MSQKVAVLDIDVSWSIPTSLYVHIPFCSSKCSYCDFFSLPTKGHDERRMEKVAMAISARAFELARRFSVDGFDTVYVGGGTPSILPRTTLGILLKSLASLAPHAREWTIEANPESIDEEFLDIIQEAGVDRLSMGVQSLDPSVIGLLERPAGADTSIAALRLASGRGLRLSADLIAGLPRRGGIAEEARILVGEGLQHISVYDLVLEKGTRLEALWRQGGIGLQNEDEAFDERKAMEAWLADRGIQRYEISNYAIIGQESQHNLAYWRMDSYLGVGPGAVGTVASTWDPSSAIPGKHGSSLRIEEVRSLGAYQEGRAASTAREAIISPRDSAFEVMMMAFRTRDGLDTASFENRFGLSAKGLIEASLQKWERHILEAGKHIALDSTGLDLGNGFLADCLLELELKYKGLGAG